MRRFAKILAILLLLITTTPWKREEITPPVMEPPQCLALPPVDSLEVWKEARCRAA